MSHGASNKMRGTWMSVWKCLMETLNHCRYNHTCIWLHEKKAFYNTQISKFELIPVLNYPFYNDALCCFVDGFSSILRDNLPRESIVDGASCRQLTFITSPDRFWQCSLILLLDNQTVCDRLLVKIGYCKDKTIYYRVSVVLSSQH